jgi:hypothetical protein
MSIPASNIKVIFIGAICFVLWGGYNIGKASYTALSWAKTEGTVVDFEHNTWSCGKGVGTCYQLIVGYYAGKTYYTVNSDKKFNHDMPTHLQDTKVTVYYSPANPAEAVLGGSYGPMNYGIILFLIGVIVLFIFWVKRERK